jgi:hypothetical protein
MSDKAYRRVPFVLAVARGSVNAIIDTLDKTKWKGGFLDEIWYKRAAEWHTFFAWTLDKNANFSPASSGTNGRWTLFLVTPDPSDWDHGTQLFRYLRRASIAAPTNLQGPWSAKRFARDHAALAAGYFGTGADFHLPHVVESMSPEGDSAIDYDPSDAACIADTEADPEALFPEPGGGI